MTTVKDVLEMGDITLDPDDAVSPSLKSKVTEATVVTINRADADVETSDTEIAFNEVRKETSSLPKGQEKVETEGQKGIMETTSLVKRAGDKVVSSNVFASWVKKAPVDKVILVGTGSTKSPSSADLGTTVPAGEVQSWRISICWTTGIAKRTSPLRTTSSTTSPVGAPPPPTPRLVLMAWVRPTPVARCFRRCGLADQLQDPVQVVHQLLRAALRRHRRSVQLLDRS